VANSNQQQKNEPPEKQDYGNPPQKK